MVHQTKPFILGAVESQFFGRGGYPGRIHRNVHHFGIAAIAGNRGNGEFDGHWLALVMKHVGMNKKAGLTRHVAEREGF
ncbi:uncharacterized protein TNCV_1356371 [Trichonephila clavipes]|uniref:Uncharacterized protein n=1 Tax=Trichonephila clavipes TaxID=2585209 RepID=A0A8X6SGX4_TRICX|nr:uncharacterized protein TNCV_1356371 [Trichonephila clavipes]